jgi:hypothetical protein
VAEIAEGYRRAPETAPTRFEAAVSWLGGYRTETRFDGSVAVRGDEPEALAGTGTGPSPEAMLLKVDAGASREQLQSVVDDALATAPIPNAIARPVPVSARVAYV